MDPCKRFPKEDSQVVKNIPKSISQKSIMEIWEELIVLFYIPFQTVLGLETKNWEPESFLNMRPSRVDCSTQNSQAVWLIA